MPCKKFRNCCITSFSDEVKYDKEYIRYIVYHREVCPDTQKLHYHVYVEFDGRFSLKKIKEIFNDNTIHCEERKGKQKEAIDYVLKDVNENDYPLFEYGEKRNQGQRTDLKGLVKSVKEGKSNLELIDEFPSQFLKFHKGIDKIRFEVNKSKSKEFRQVKVYVLYGEPGTGKTRNVYENVDDLYKLDCGNNLWFDGYSGEKNILIDDFYGWVQYGQLLNILDGYQLRIPIKGGFTYALWDNVYITSNKHPKYWYKGKWNSNEGLKRRITQKIKFEKNDNDKLLDNPSFQNGKIVEKKRENNL